MCECECECVCVCASVRACMRVCVCVCVCVSNLTIDNESHAAGCTAYMELERETSRGIAGGRDVKTVLLLTRCVVCVGVQLNQCI